VLAVKGRRRPIQALRRAVNQRPTARPVRRITPASAAPVGNPCA
jgi:hypothetical protein